MQASVVEQRISISAKTFALAALAIASVWLLVRLFPVLLVLVAAAILSGTLSPAVEWLEKRGMKRGAAIGIVFTTLIASIAVLVLATVPALIEQLRTLAENEPEMRQRVVGLLNDSPVTMPLARWVRSVRYAALASESADTALDFSTRAVEGLAYVASAVFLALYFLIDRNRLRGMIFAMIPRRRHLRAGRVTIELETIVGGYVRGQLLTSAMMTGFVFVLLLLCGISNPLPIAVLAGAADVLPYIGVVLSIAPAAAAAIPQGIGIVALVVGVMLVYEELESRFIIPRVYGNVLRLPSSVVLIALLAGGSLLGIVGALLALPVAAAIRMLVEQLRVDLPGETPASASEVAREAARETDYLQRVEGMSAERAAVIAIAMSVQERRENDAQIAAAAAKPHSA